MWDLNPRDFFTASVPGASACAALRGRANGVVESVCQIPDPLEVEYTITDGANFSTASLTLHLETPNTVVIPPGTTQTARK